MFVTPVRKPLDKAIVSETMGVKVMSGIEVLRSYAIRAAVRLVSKGLETVTSLSNALHVFPANSGE